jgi:hypothetical protein
MQIISIKNKSIDVSVLLNEESEDFFTNFVKSIKDSTDLSFDQKTNILRLTFTKSLKTSLTNFVKIYDSLCDDDKEKIDIIIETNNYHLDFAENITELMNSFLSKKILEEDLFVFFAFALDTKFFNEPFEFKLGNSKTAISITNVKDITLPTKSQWELIKKHIKN